MENTSSHNESTESTEVTKSNVQKHKTINTCPSDQISEQLKTENHVDKVVDAFNECSDRNSLASDITTCTHEVTGKGTLDMVVSLTNEPRSSMELGACDVMKEACSYVESVMTSKIVTSVTEMAEIAENTKTPTTNGRKRTLSAQSVDENVNKKVKNSSTENLNTKSEKRRVVNVRRNLAGKSNSKEHKPDGQSIHRNGRTNDEANTHRQRSAALKQTNKQNVEKRKQRLELDK